jgi:hypothetical protein
MTQGGFGSIEMNLDSDLNCNTPKTVHQHQSQSMVCVGSSAQFWYTGLFQGVRINLSNSDSSWIHSASQQKAEQGEEYDDYGPSFTFQDSKGEVIATGQIHGGLLGWGSHWLLVRCERGEIADLLIAELSKTSTHRSAL